MVKSSSILLFILLIIWQSVSIAQGVFYWSQNYGTTSNLLGGLVIGSVRDVTATYYNPGYLGLSDPELIIGSKIYEYNDYKVDIENFENSDLSSSKFAASPSFIAGSFGSDSSTVHKLFYSFLVRQNSEIKFDFKTVQNSPKFENLDSYVNETIFDRNLGEYWLGFSWGFAPKENVGLGLTPYAAIRSDKVRGNTNFSEQDTSGSISTAQNINEYKYFNVRLLAKFGILWQLSPFTLGFNFTTPSINLFGWGKTFLNLSASDRINDDGSIEQGFLISDFQEKLDSRYKNSLTLGFGASYEFGKSKLHITIEWFNKVPEYTILDPDPFTGQSTGDTIDNDIKMELKSIINYGLGYEFVLTEKVKVLGSFFVDHNANKSISQLDLFDVDMTIYHFSAGANIIISSVLLTAGLEFAYSSNGFQTDDSFANKVNHQRIEDLTTELSGTLRYFRIKGILSASFQL
jgi:hypothetical protein